MGLLGNESGACSLCVTTVLTTIMVIVIGGTVHYTLKGHEQERATQLIAQAQAAGEREAVAVSRVFASLGGGLIQADLFRIQEMLQTGFAQEGLVDAVILDSDNMIVAAKNPSQIGQQVRDIAWISVRAQNKEVVTRTPDQANQLLVTVVEPMKAQDETVAWAKMTYSLAQPDVSLLPPVERMKRTGILIVPLALLLFVWTFAGVRWIEHHQEEGHDDADFSGEEEETKTPAVRRLKKVS